MDIEKIKLDDVSKHLSEISDPPKKLYIRGKKPDTSKTFTCHTSYFLDRNVFSLDLILLLTL